MDTIWGAAFGVDIDLQNNPENIYFSKCERVFKEVSEFGVPQFLGSILIYLVLFKSHSLSRFRRCSRK
jgi:hypothetical protein